MKTLHAVIITTGFALLAAGGYAVYRYAHLPAVFSVVESVQQAASAVTLERTETPATATVFLAGDVMMDRGVESRVASIGNSDFTFPFQLIADTTRAADLAFVNFEGAMSDLGTDSGKKYSFNFNTKAIDGIAFAGIDVVSLANNHMLDWGYGALCDTRNRIVAKSVAVVGAGCDKAQADAPFVAMLPDGTTVAFLAFTEFYQGAFATDDRAGLAHFAKTNVTEQIQKLRARDDIDLIFVSVHWGTEYQTLSNDFQKEWGRMMIDAGADVIVGHHPHVPQEIEEYDGKYIIYSLGNFVFDQSWSEPTMKGLAVRITTEKGVIKNLERLPIQINKNFQPTLAPQ